MPASSVTPPPNHPPVTPFESGFLAPKNVAGLALVKTPAGNLVFVANTGDSLQAFVVRKMFTEINGRAK